MIVSVIDCKQTDIFSAENHDLIMTYDETVNIILGSKDNVTFGKWWIE